MAYGIVRMQKYHSGDIGGIESHIERRAESNTNPDIQKIKSKNNYDLTGLKNFTLHSLIKKRLEKIGINEVRKNGVVMCELLFTASHDFFKDMTPEETKSYFEKCLEFAKEKYGEENVIGAEVHLDESTPHMHLELIPIKKDKLNARELFNPNELKKLQNEVHEKVFKSYGLERGDSRRQIKHVKTLEYKVLSLSERKRKLEQQVHLLEEQVHELEEFKKDNSELDKLLQNYRTAKQQLFDICSTIENNHELLQKFKEAKEKEKEKNDYSR